MLICPVCRSQNMEAAKFCGNCGHPFPRQAEPVSSLVNCAQGHIYSAVYNHCPYCPQPVAAPVAPTVAVQEVPKPVLVAARPPVAVTAEDERALRMAEAAHAALGCAGVTRSDLRYDDVNDILVLLELNTQPGMTPTSLVPEQAAAVGVAFDQLVLWMTEDAHARGHAGRIVG